MPEEESPIRNTYYTTLVKAVQTWVHNIHTN